MVESAEIASFDEETKRNLQIWLDGEVDGETKAEIRAMLKESPQELTDAFYKTLSFGTGGLRGIMGVGTNRMNPYTVRAATQGFANYLKRWHGESEKLRILIGYDTRHHSRTFAEEAAKVLAANGIEVLLFAEFRPTPLVSFGCRYKECSGAIMITASHNPPEYNGYKVYWKNGGQVLPPHDIGIIEEVNRIEKFSSVKVAEGVDHPLITIVDGELDAAYYKEIYGYQCSRESNGQNGGELKIVYSNIHGTGITMVPEALRQWGFTNLSLVDGQKEPDGAFPTVKSPNPEEPEALKLGIEQLLREEADIFLATDPDADRVGIVVNHRGEAKRLSGNQIACLSLEHICSSLHAKGALPEDGAFIKSVVTSELFRKITDFYKRPCFDVLTGFKHFGRQIDEWEERGENFRYIFGAEESFGYLLGSHARDKDGVIACALLAEAALAAKLSKKTLIDQLFSIYEKYGASADKLHSLKFPETKAGHEQMEVAMDNIFRAPPLAIAGRTVTAIADYRKLEIRDRVTGETSPIVQPETNLISFTLDGATKLHIRPSGTEPKIKLYCGVMKEKGSHSIEEALHLCERECEEIIDWICNYLKR